MDQIVYPLTLDQRVLQRDLSRKDISTLNQALQTIRQECSQKCSGKAFAECAEHLTLGVEKYHDYYLNPEGGRWHSELTSYRTELQTMFDTEGCTMKDVQERANQELRQHIKNDLIATDSDSEPVRAYKQRAVELLNDGEDIDHVFDFLLAEQTKNLGDEDTARLAHEIQEAYTPTDRKAIYIRYYCTPSPNDSKRVQNFKSKYTRQFQQELSHDTVLEAMRKEAQGSQIDDASHLHVRLNELQMAQSAHVKSLARKAEKDRKMQDFEPTPEPITVPCTLPDCGIRVALEDEEYAGPIECGLCDWLSQNSSTRQRVLYCSSQHAEQDFVGSYSRRESFPSG
ncbi:hypothetical protein PVAG01_06904 [Phlyctema vagabunda]|uniref:Uncharacterized protein n=1 Tax=Phlyctema vagabunda TaxID=108571 RepID=A0ABR4PHF0_9HELO